VPVGHALLVPSQVTSAATIASLKNAVFTTVPSGRAFYHRVRKGETLASIAARYDVSTQDLKGWNAGHAAKIVPGQRLRVVSDVGQGQGKKSKRGAKTRVLSAKPAAGKGGGRTKPASAPASRARRHTAQR
jgi:LysM repeat protein